LDSLLGFALAQFPFCLKVFGWALSDLQYKVLINKNLL